MSDAPAIRTYRRGGFAWREAGAGPVLLCLHGIPDSGRAWDGVTARLAPGMRVIAPDLPGFGDSAPPGRLAGLGDLRAAMDDLAAALDLPPAFALAVHDVGGLFGLAWAAARPARIAALIILNTGPFPDRRWHWGARVLRTAVVGRLAMRAMPRGAFRAQVRRASAGHRSADDIDRTFADFGPAARATARRLYRLQTPDRLAGLPQAVRGLAGRVPSLVVWGGRDPYLPSAFADRFGAGTIRLHDDLGHWPHCEAPERVAADIRGLLDVAGAGRP
jgi:pimeloyl-ACP methyl ester carboxylesterase